MTTKLFGRKSSLERLKLSPGWNFRQKVNFFRIGQNDALSCLELILDIIVVNLGPFDPRGQVRVHSGHCTLTEANSGKPLVQEPHSVGYIFHVMAES